MTAPAGGLQPQPAHEGPQEAAALKKAYWRLVPMVCLGFILASLGRVNISFAAAEMSRDLGLSSTTFALGAGIFFAGYLLLEVPSNLILQRVGARVWITRIMVTWGLVCGAMALVSSGRTFVAMRLALGVAEAGYFPGILLYLTYWFPSAYRARAMALFLISAPISSVIGAPLAAALMGLDGLAGIEGWRWLFVGEGAPSVLLGLALWRWLPNGPRDARWLTPEQQDLLIDRLRTEADGAGKAHRGALGALADPRVLLLSAAHLLWLTGFYGLTFWLPQMVAAFGHSRAVNAIILATPPLIGVAVMLAWARRSDRVGERVWHVALGGLVGALGLGLSAVLQAPVAALIAITAGIVGLYAFYSVFWTLPEAFLRGRAAAAGLAFISAFGNVGGLVGPLIVGALKTHLGDYRYALLSLAAAPLVASVLVVLLPRLRRAPA